MSSADLQPPSLQSESSHGLREPASYVPCGVCQHEIPLSAAVWREASDYVAYFCGLEMLRPVAQTVGRSVITSIR